MSVPFRLSVSVVRSDLLQMAVATHQERTRLWLQSRSAVLLWESAKGFLLPIRPFSSPDLPAPSEDSRYPKTLQKRVPHFCELLSRRLSLKFHLVSFSSYTKYQLLYLFQCIFFISPARLFGPRREVHCLWSLYVLFILDSVYCHLNLFVLFKSSFQMVFMTNSVNTPVLFLRHNHFTIGRCFGAMAPV